MKIGVMFGNPETTTGGNALKFYASVRIDLRRKDSLKQGETFIGNVIRAKIVKNKVAAPFKEAMFETYFDEGISRAADILELGIQYNIIDKSGTWLAFENEKLGQGKENARLFLKGNAKTLAKIEKEILKKVKEGVEVATKS